VRKAKATSSKKLRVLALMHEDLIPPEEVTIKGEALEGAPWKTEYDVMRTLQELGHEVRPLGIGSELGPLRTAIEEFKPEIAFNLVEGFADVSTFDQNVVAYLELLKLPYTGCNSRGLLLARDKAIAKKLLSYHRIPVPGFAIFPRGRRIRRPSRLKFPLFVKSLNLDASIGISQASVVETDEKLEERVKFIHESTETDALVEQFIDGRELYVGVMGNGRLDVLPIWELTFTKMPEELRRIATERLKWSMKYQKKHGINSEEAKDLPNGMKDKIRDMCKRVYRNLMLSGYARIDLRMSETTGVHVIEANPNPQLSYDEDFAQSAKKTGIAYGDLIQRILNLGLRWEPTRYG
jgi:D-alanine-D-alanine ligase